jgi:undecaprenyl diphosphate synthase
MDTLSKEDSASVTTLKLPEHVAIIMDGNGRWAKQKGKLRTFGHKAGVEAVRASVRFARKHKITALTLFAFSSENWNRPQDEVSVLMELFKLVLTSEVKRLHKNGVRLRVIGDLSAFDDKLVKKIKAAEALTEHNTELHLNIAANYGGRWDMVTATKALAQQVAEGTMSVDAINETSFDAHTAFADCPALDLMIRTGGEQRISNFLLWQCAYSEFYFTDTLWPDFNEDKFMEAVVDFSERQRRFGKISEQVS